MMFTVLFLLSALLFGASAFLTDVTKRSNKSCQRGLSLRAGVSNIEVQLSVLAQQISDLQKSIDEMKKSRPSSESGPSQAILAQRAKITGNVYDVWDEMKTLKLGQANAASPAVVSPKPATVITPVAAAVPAVSPSTATPTQATSNTHAISVDWDGKIYNFECTSDQTILQAALDKDIQLPSSCMSGTCFTCPAKILKGSVDQEEGALDDEQKEKGFCLTCVSYPESDVDIKIVREEDL